MNAPLNGEPPAGPDLLAVMDDNLAVHFGWHQAGGPGMRAWDSRSLVLIDSGLPCSTFNVVCRARMPPGAAQRLVARAIRHFERVQRPFSWWVGPADQPPDLADLLAGFGLANTETETGMAIRLHATPPAPEAPTGLEIRRVFTPGQLGDFARVLAANWDPPDVHVTGFYEAVTGRALSPRSPLHLFVGYVDGAPVATAEICIASGAAGLYSVATLQDHRCRGYGGAMTLHALCAARAEGCRTAVLQASRDGLGIYARIGFEPVGEYREFTPA